MNETCNFFAANDIGLPLGSKSDADFSEMLSLPKVFHCFFQFFKRKYAIYHWLYLVLAHGPRHGFE